MTGVTIDSIRMDIRAKVRDFLSNVRLVSQDPSRIASGLNRLYHTNFHTSNFNPEGISIFDEEWDNLILLDACRFDSFVRHSELPGKTDYRYSRGSMSEEFIRGNFRNVKRYDTVYVSANYWYKLLREELNSEIFRFASVERDGINRVTSKPSTVTDRATELYSQHPKKKFIIHYLQPHQPYFGQTGNKIEYNQGLYKTARDSDLCPEAFRRAYNENLKIVLSEVEKLIENISGRTIVSSDHGELIGHKTWPIPIHEFGHPPGIYVDDLVKIPWHIYEDGRRDIKSAESPFVDQLQQDFGEINSQLSDLGYK